MGTVYRTGRGSGGPIPPKVRITACLPPPSLPRIGVSCRVPGTPPGPGGVLWKTVTGKMGTEG